MELKKIQYLVCSGVGFTEEFLAVGSLWKYFKKRFVFKLFTSNWKENNVVSVGFI